MKARYKHVEHATTRHGKAALYFRRGKGARVRLPPDQGSAAFRFAYFAALNGHPTPYVGPKNETNKQRAEWTIRQSLGRARQRSREKRCAFTLTLDWALAQLEQQEFRCAVTRIAFFAPSEAICQFDPYAPSFDRIDARGGYTPDNVRIVVFALNAMLLDWGIGVFETVANAYRYHRHRTKYEHPTPAPDDTRPAPRKSSRKINALEARK